MIRPTFFGIEIGKSGLTISQLGLDITGHNIANVDTAGYTRQRLISKAYDANASLGRAMPVSRAIVGGGVDVKIHDQIRSAYLDIRYRTENTINSYWQARTRNLSYLETFFDDYIEETSINYSIASFFGAIKVLAEDTVEGAPRKLLQIAGKDMTQHLNTIYAGLIELQESQDVAVDTTVNKINWIGQEIVDLNKAIYRYEVSGLIALDLRDKRNLLLDELSSLINIQYVEYEDPKDSGMAKLRVWIGEGDPDDTNANLFIDHKNMHELETVKSYDENDDYGDYFEYCVNVIDGEAPVFHIKWKDIDDIDETKGFNLGHEMYSKAGEPFKVKGGELDAYMEMRDGDSIDHRGIPYYVMMLNNLAKALVQEINSVHRQGWNDDPNGSLTWIDFFGFMEDGEYVDADGIFEKMGLSAGMTLEELIDQFTTGADVAGMLADEETYREYWQSQNLAIPYKWLDPDDPEVAPSLYAEFAARVERAVAAREYDIVYNEIIVPQITAKNICLNEYIAKEGGEYNISCSTVEIDRNIPNGLQSGNNENMNKLYDLFLKKDISIDMADGTQLALGSFDGYATSIRFDLATTLNYAKKTSSTSNILTIAAQNQRLEISGVSLDEEMTNLMKYQHAYNGASRVITTMDDALDVLINRTGRVGL